MVSDWTGKLKTNQEITYKLKFRATNIFYFKSYLFCVNIFQDENFILSNTKKEKI